MENDGQASAATLRVIDDEPALCGFVRAVAEGLGYAVSVHLGAEDAGALDPPWPDVIALDLAMPGIDGIEALRRLGAQQCPSRILLMSGFDRRVLETATQLAVERGLGVIGHVEKPMRAATLRTLLARGAPTERAAKRGAAPRLDRDDLDRGIRAGELLLHYQPQVSLATGAIIGYEALVRWQHPEHGLLYPDAFIPIAERGGLALPLTYQVLELLPGLARALDGAPRPLIAVNLPPAALVDVAFPEAVSQMLAGIGIDGMRVQFEVTETSVAADPVKALDILTRLRLRGFQLSLDDFGTGHASLDQLRRTPFSELKIDMSFVRAAEVDPTARVIVEKSVALGRDLGMRVLAEGVESQRLWNWLRETGCDCAQGYHIARPMPPEGVPVWAREWAARPN